jgi:hypothetical protein
MNKLDYLRDENWSGGFYELAIEYYPKGNDSSLLRAMTVVWNKPSVVGPWKDRETFMLQPSSIGKPYPNTLYGLLTLSNGHDAGCQMFTIREDAATGSDWLILGIPMGMLERVFHIVYPPADVSPSPENNAWMQELDRVLLELALTIYKTSPFNLAIIGHEVSGEAYQNGLTAEVFDVVSQYASFVLPFDVGQSLNREGETIVSFPELLWFPRKYAH